MTTTFDKTKTYRFDPTMKASDKVFNQWKQISTVLQVRDNVVITTDGTYHITKVWKVAK